MLLNTESDPKRRLWIILDEIAALQKLSSLGTGLAEIRKNGGCFLGGTQSIQQLQSLYGRDKASGYLDLFNTRVFFRSKDHETLQWISKSIGKSQIEETNEFLSYGANTVIPPKKEWMEGLEVKLICQEEGHGFEVFNFITSSLPFGRLKAYTLLSAITRLHIRANVIDSLPLFRKSKMPPVK